MLWSRRLVLLGASALAGCGFEPVLAPSGSADDLFGQIDIAFQGGRANFEFRTRLIERLGQAGPTAPYRLEYTLGLDETVVTISSDANIDRYNLTGVASFQIIEQATNLPVFSDRVRASAGYSATAETFPTRVAARDAELRLVQALADQMVQIIQLSADQIIQ
ncbi:MAG: LPS assembly lipoprotein LptE [Pseudomonadota bacterium]